MTRSTQLSYLNYKKYTSLKKWVFIILSFHLPICLLSSQQESLEVMEKNNNMSFCNKCKIEGSTSLCNLNSIKTKQKIKNHHWTLALWESQSKNITTLNNVFGNDPNNRPQQIWTMSIKLNKSFCGISSTLQQCIFKVNWCTIKRDYSGLGQPDSPSPGWKEILPLKSCLPLFEIFQEHGK